MQECVPFCVLGHTFTKKLGTFCARGKDFFKKTSKKSKNLFGKQKIKSYLYKKLKHMFTQERKTKVAQLMVQTADKWNEVYGKETEATQEEKDEYTEFREKTDKEIDLLIPPSEKLSICLSGCAAEDVSHYDIEDSLQEFFKPGEGVQYDSEGGQFWMYVKPTLVHQVLRWVDFHFPGKIDLVVDVNRYDSNPWFQNWTQARKYLASLEVGAETEE